MAQRVALVQMPADQLARVTRSVCGTASERQEAAAVLARAAAPHFRRVAASECVADAVEAPDRELPPPWSFAHNCLPFLIAGKDADTVHARLTELERIDTTADLESFFVQEARTLGLEPGPLDRANFTIPNLDDVQRWIAGLLDRAAALRTSALAAASGRRSKGGENPVANFAISTWIWLARIFARTHVCFWQGRNRWLGGAAFPEAFQVGTEVTRVGPLQALWRRLRTWLFGQDPEDELDAEFAHIIALSQEVTRRQLATHAIQRLRGIVESVATLAPELAVAGWHEYLPAHGDGNLATGGVASQSLGDLIATMHYMESEGAIPYDTGTEWVQIVVAAARAAQQANAHLVEGDDVLLDRWPIVQ